MDYPGGVGRGCGVGRGLGNGVARGVGVGVTVGVGVGVTGVGVGVTGVGVGVGVPGVGVGLPPPPKLNLPMRSIQLKPVLDEGKYWFTCQKVMPSLGSMVVMV